LDLKADEREIEILNRDDRFYEGVDGCKFLREAGYVKEL